MNTLSVEQLKEKVLSYIDGDISTDDLSKWAINTHWQYEKRQLEFVDGDRKKMLETIIDLIYANVEGFADSKKDLKKKLEEL